MKRIIEISAGLFMAIAMLTGCDKDDDKTVLSPEIVGEWHLTGLSVNGTEVESDDLPKVYISFYADGSFELYQMTGEELRYYKYTGSCKMEGGKLTGSYSDGASLATDYTVSYEDAVLVLTATDGSEVQKYKRESLPAEDKSQANLVTKGCDAPAAFL